ncbi:hypothetical protein LguiA_020769 [Lonicera macranthoides]
MRKVLTSEFLSHNRHKWLRDKRNEEADNLIRYELMMTIVDNPSIAIKWAIAKMINQPHTLRRAIKELDKMVGTHKLVQESDFP